MQIYGILLIIYAWLCKSQVSQGVFPESFWGCKCKRYESGIKEEQWHNCSLLTVNEYVYLELYEHFKKHARRPINILHLSNKVVCIDYQYKVWNN